ncbi:hypothetical protein ACOBV9_18920 (plasmid) [Pseudoalteromonas espejiana]
MGEEYLTGYFRVYLKYANKDEIKAYKVKYPAPEGCKGWKGWYDEN